ncbi:MAG TPA: sugar-binding protein [Rariglobus sp.]|nr:sugar-binding protein [Rariglobus sp.]
MNPLVSLFRASGVKLLAIALMCSAATAQEFSLYPRSDDVPNPRVPAVPPARGGAVGRAMDVETRFTYDLAPFVTFAGAGSVDVQLRDNPRRQRKTALTLGQGDVKITLGFAAASAGRTPFLAVEKDGKKLTSVSLGEPWGASWKKVRLDWSGQRITVTVEGREAGSLELPSAFSPVRVELETWHVDEVKIEGRGSFSIGWENGYAASVVPVTGDVVQARLFGFDTYAVSNQSEQRDFPMVQVLNGRDDVREVTFEFALRGEISGTSQDWTQTVAVGARTGKLAPLRFPAPLADDVYHLKVSTRGLGTELDTDVHFLSVARRDEPKGPAKFGLHDSGNQVFGSWPDALGMDFAHVYSYWGYVVGPAWVKDDGISYGIDPSTPPEQWAWNKRVDWLLGQGLTPYVSLQSEPLQVWMRERLYPKQKIKKSEWGERGGFPKLDLYRKFVREFAQRYKGRVLHYEIENEPNAGGDNGIPPEEYVPIAQAVFEEVRAVDPAARVFGICGTGNFVPWMTKVFADGGDKFMDGVSVHTYVTPQLPEQANLAGKLAEVKALIAKTGRAMPVINSETGTYVALREQVDRPIPADRLKELIDAGTPMLAVSRGWPNHALSEQTGSLSIVRNAVYNFLAGAERFVFFGWNPKWPASDWAAEKHRGSSAGGFALISATMDGVRTPSWQTLAIGVLTAQLEGAVIKGVRPLDQGGVLGGVFPKQNGGEVGVLWSSMGTRSILLETKDAELELVSLYGQRRVSRVATSADGVSRHAIELTEDPVYVHVKKPGIAIMPSPVLTVRQTNRDDGTVGVEFTLINRAAQPWNGRVEFAPQHGWRFEPATVPFSLKAGGRASFKVDAHAPEATDRAVRMIEGRTRLADGSPFSFPVGLAAKPVMTLATLPDAVNAETMRRVSMAGTRLRLDRPEQVMIGRPPQLTSIQEEQFWKGSAELSGEVKLGRNARGLYVFVDVTDAQPHAPAPWPGVKGSAVELFFDFRAAGAGFGGGFGPGAYQVVLKPALNPGDAVEVWNASSAKGVLADTSAIGGRTSKGYWMLFHIPWESTGRTAADGAAFGFDAGIDGPVAEGGNRKSQLILFGTAANNASTADYGLVIAPKK